MNLDAAEPLREILWLTLRVVMTGSVSTRSAINYTLPDTNRFEPTPSRERFIEFAENFWLSGGGRHWQGCLGRWTESHLAIQDCSCTGRRPKHEHPVASATDDGPKAGGRHMSCRWRQPASAIQLTQSRHSVISLTLRD